jgi:hypothetical protein
MPGTQIKHGNLNFVTSGDVAPLLIAPIPPDALFYPPSFRLGSSSTTWTAAGSGNFNTASNWNNGVPASGVDGYIEEASTNSISVTISSASNTADALITDYAGLVLQNATLTLQGTSSTTSINTGTTTALTQSGGLLEFQNGPSGSETSLISSTSTAVVQNSGTIQIDAGTLEINGNSSFAGTITGTAPLASGTLLLSGSSTFTFLKGASLSVSEVIAGGGSPVVALGANLSYGGDFNDNSGTLSLGKSTFSLSGTGSLSYLDVTGTAGKIANSGSLVLGTGVAIAGSETLANTGTLVINGGVQLGDTASAKLTNSATGVIELQAGASLAANSTSSLTNSGTLETVGTAFTSTLSAVLTNSGLISVAAETVLDQSNAFTNTGTVSGPGTFQLNSGGVDTLAAGSVLSGGEFVLNVFNDIVALNIDTTSITVGTFALEQGGQVNFNVNLAYAGDFIASSNAALLNMSVAGQTLTLSGPTTFAATNFGFIEFAGAGTVSLTGATSLTLDGLILGEGATLINNGTVTASGALQIGDATGASAFATNSAGAVWDLIGGAGLSIGTDTSATFTNLGLFEDTASGTNANIGAQFSNAATVLVQSAGSTLSFRDGGTFTGTLTGAGEIDLRGGQSYAVSGSTALTVATLGIYDSGTNMVLTGADSYAGALTLGTGATLTLATAKTSLTLTGADTLSGTLLGSGAVLIGAGASLVTDGLTIGGSVSLTDNKAVIAQGANITIGNAANSTASLVIDAKSTYELTGNATIYSDGLGAISNAGTFEKLQGTGLSTISPLVTNTGTVATSSGTLAFASNFTNNKLAEASNGSSLSFAGAVSATGNASGTISLLSGGFASFGGYVGSAETLQFADSSSMTATLGDATAFDATITGFGATDELHLLDFTNNSDTYSDGVLTLTGSSNGSLVTVDLHFSGNYTIGSFTIQGDNAGGTEILFAGTHH